MSTVTLELVMRDHNPAQGYHFVPENPRNPWAKIIESEAKRVENLSEDECNQTIRVRPKNNQLKGQLIIIPKIIRSGDRTALKILSALWHDTLPPLTNISIIEDKLRNEDFTNSGNSIAIRLTQSEIKKSTIWHPEAVELIGRDVSKSQDISTEGFPKKAIFCAWACCPPEVRQNTDLVIGGENIRKTKLRRWHHSFTGTKTPLVSESTFFSDYKEGQDFTLQQLLIISDSLSRKGSWWKNLQVVMDNHGLNVSMNRMALMRHRLHLSTSGSSERRLTNSDLRSQAVKDLEILVRAGDANALNVFFKAGPILTPEEINSISPKRRYTVVYDMINRFEEKSISITFSTLNYLKNNEIIELLKSLNLDFEKVINQESVGDYETGTVSLLMGHLLKKDKSLFLKLLSLQESKIKSQETINLALVNVNSEIPIEAIPILGLYSPSQNHVLISHDKFSSLIWEDYSPGTFGRKLAEIHVEYIKKLPSALWIIDFGKSLRKLAISNKQRHTMVELNNWLIYLFKHLPTSIKSRHCFEFAKLWPRSESPWIKMVLSHGTRPELREMFYSSDTKSQKEKSEKLRNNLSSEMLGDWLRSQNSMLARPLFYTNYDDARNELFRLHINPTQKEKANGIYSRVMLLLTPLSFASIVFIFLKLYDVIDDFDGLVSVAPAAVMISWFTFAITLGNNIISRKIFKRLITEADL